MTTESTRIRKNLFSGQRLILLIYLILFIPLFRPIVDGLDPVGYYAWARSVLIDHDLNVANEFDHYGILEHMASLTNGKLTPTGYFHNQFAAGSALLWLPAMTVAHLIASLAQSLGLSVQADGYSIVYTFASGLTSTLSGLVAVLLCHSIARRLFDDYASTLASITVWLATPLVFYQYAHPMLSHANDALAHALFVYTWWQTAETKPRFQGGMLRGLAAGLALWVRTQNAILLVALLGEAAFDILVAWRRDGLGTALKNHLPILAGLAVGYYAWLLPLMVFWRVVFGAWIINTYQAVNPPLDWRAPHAIEILISTDRGMFTWAPITLLALIGTRWLYSAHKRMTLILAAVFGMQWYLLSGWFAWSGASAFGPRFWVSMTPLFTLGLAALLKRLGRVPRATLVGVASLFIVWNLILIVQFSLGTIPRSGPVDFNLLIRNQFLVIPQNVGRLAAAMLTRR